MSPLSRYFPCAVLVLASFYVIAAAAPGHDKDDGLMLNEFGKLPVSEGGRVKPFDSVARSTLMVISDRQSWRDKDGNAHPATEWLLDVMTGAGAKGSSVTRRAFRVEDESLRALLDLPPRSDGLYTYAEFAAKVPKLAEEVKRASAVEPEKRTAFDTHLLDFGRTVGKFMQFAKYETPHKVFRIENDQVLNLLGLEHRSGLRYGFDEIVPRMAQLMQAEAKAGNLPEEKRDLFDNKVLDLSKQVRLYLQMATLDTLRVIPPVAGNAEWQNLAYLQDQAESTGQDNAAFASWKKLLTGYRNQNPREFNSALADYEVLLGKEMPGDLHKTGFETFYNHFEPFYQCTILYVVVFLLACGAWLGWSQPLNRAAFWLTVLTLVIHTFGLIGRMYLMGRFLVFVTNLYSSAIFIGWVAVLTGLILETIFQNGIGNLLAGLIGAITTLIAHNLAASGADTMEMMRAVLDTNLWLATHVTTVTIGYAATFVSGFLGLLFIGMGVFSRELTTDLRKVLTQMIYGVVCFAMFFSFVGTVLGGIWADQSWGRFWGWDAKENGALLIVIWNALILHARWGGLVKQRGIACLAVFGNIVTSWSWFGVNLLGVGLHSYGFTKGQQVVLGAWWLFNLAAIGVGLLPMRMWKSFADKPGEPKPPQRRPPRERRDDSTAVVASPS